MSVDLGPESVLTDWDDSDNPIDDTIAKLVTASKFISNWRQAQGEGDIRLVDRDPVTLAKIDGTSKKVSAALTAWNKPDLEFPGNNEVSLYKQAQLSYPDTWRAVQLSIGTEGNYSPLSLGGLFDSVPDAGGGLGNWLKDILLNFLKGFWPVLLIAGIVIVGYVFRKSLFKAR